MTLVALFDDVASGKREHPHTLHIQVDGGSDNKCKWYFQYCAWLIRTEVFQEPRPVNVLVDTPEDKPQPTLDADFLHKFAAQRPFVEMNHAATNLVTDEAKAENHKMYDAFCDSEGKTTDESTGAFFGEMEASYTWSKLPSFEYVSQEIDATFARDIVDREARVNSVTPLHRVEEISIVGAVHIPGYMYDRYYLLHWLQPEHADVGNGNEYTWEQQHKIEKTATFEASDMENEEISVWWGPEKGKVTQAAEYVGVANSVLGNNVALQISYQDSEVEIIDAHSLSFIDSRSEEGGDNGIQSHEGKRLAWIAAAHKNEHVLAKLDSMFSSSINFTCQAEKEKRKRSISPSEQRASRRRTTKAPVKLEKDNFASASDTVRRKIALGDVREQDADAGASRKQCKCGSTKHSRINHKECRLNPKNIEAQKGHEHLQGKVHMC